MKRIALLVPFALICAANPATANATVKTLLQDDFQDGSADGWAARGDGDVRVTDYAGNKSLRLQNKAEALTAVSTKGYRDITITVQFAASSLEGSDACVLEASADKGLSWFELGRIGDGQDDALTLHTVGGVVPALANTDPVYIRLRAEGNDTNDTCWGDNVRAVGKPIAKAEPARLEPAFFDRAVVPDVPLDLSAFTQSVEAVAANEPLNGRITISPHADRAKSTVHHDLFGDTQIDNSYEILPPLEIDLVSDGAAVVPVARGTIPTGHPDWEWIVQPGKSWKEPADGEWNRASLPVALRERNANCTHNGVLTFRYKSDAISPIFYEFGSETCAYFKVDLWGFADASLADIDSATDRQTVLADYQAEVANRIPVRPIEEIGQVYPGTNPAAFGSVLEVKPADLTTHGFVADGVLWAGGCDTRFGSYPFCETIALPSYSLAKSTFGGVGLMRLESLYPGTKDRLISQSSTDCKVGEGWAGVSLHHALDMATGNYDDDGFSVDEDGADMRALFIATTDAEKTKVACTGFKNRTGPGEKWVYHTSDTYLLGRGMQQAWRENNGDSGDVYSDMMVGQIWKPLGLSPLSEVTQRTYDTAAQPFTGWGLTYQPSDLAKVAEFLQQDGKIDDEPLLDSVMLAAALQKDPADRGLPAGGADYRYKNGFWAWNANEALGCSGDMWIPFMSGHGGIALVLFPNGMSYYYVSDGYDYAWASAARAANAIKPFCTTGNAP